MIGNPFICASVIVTAGAGHAITAESGVPKQGFSQNAGILVAHDNGTSAITQARAFRNLDSPEAFRWKTVGLPLKRDQKKKR